MLYPDNGGDRHIIIPKESLRSSEALFAQSTISPSQQYGVLCKTSN